MNLKTVLAAAVLYSTPMLMAEVSGPEYPPPGGVTFTASGPGNATAGGKTFSYSGFDPSQYSQLYWGPVDVSNVNNVGDGTPGDMQFVGLNAGSYEFDSTADWVFNGTFTGTVDLPTRMLLTVSGLGAEDTQGDIGATTPNSGYPLFLVTGTFSANFLFEVDYDGTWTPINDFQNSNNNLGPENQTSVNFAFFDTAPTPEPSSFLLLGTGGLVLVIMRLRPLLARGSRKN